MIVMDMTTRYAMRVCHAARSCDPQKKWPGLPITQLPFDTSFVLRLSASAVVQLLGLPIILLKWNLDYVLSRGSTIRSEFFNDVLMAWEVRRICT